MYKRIYLSLPYGKEDEGQCRGAGDAAVAAPSSSDVSALVTLIECNCLFQILLKPFQSPLKLGNIDNAVPWGFQLASSLRSTINFLQANHIS